MDLDKQSKIRLLYLFAIIFWIIIIILIGFLQTDLAGKIILLLPIVVFLINCYFAAKSTEDAQGELFRGDFLSFALLVAIILINWSKVGDRKQLYKIIAIAIVLITLSLVDVWVDKETLIYEKHTRTILQTGSLSLLIFALYYYYIDMEKVDMTLLCR